MHQVRTLIAQIRASLSNAPSPYPIEALAAEYARRREEAARRLDACAGMLARGSEHSALELAEAAPPLLDLVAELSFAEEPQWQALCTRNDLPTGPLLDSRTISALDAVYAKGLSPNSPLYQDYRAAVTERDDMKALHIIRTIARVNPSDANAQAELDRLRNKFMHARLETLREAFAANDDSAIADLVDELQELATPEKLQAQPDFPRGLAVRKRVRLADATRELPVLLAELERLQQSGDVALTAERLAFLEDQERELGLTLDATQASRRDAVRKFVSDRRADSAEQSRFLQAVERLRVAGEQAATRAAGASTLTLEEARGLEAKFDQLDHEVKQFRRTVPAGAAESINASRRALHGAGARIRRGILFRRVALAALVVVALGAGLAWFGRTRLVSAYQQRLAEFQRDGQALAAQELLQKIRKYNILWIHSAPELQAAMAETGNWVSGQAELRSQAEAQVAVLEKSDPAKADTVDMYEHLSAASKLADSLAPDMALPLKERIAAARRSMDSRFVKLRESGIATWGATFAEAQALLSPVGFDTPSAEVVAALAKAAPVMRALEFEVKHPVPTLRPDPDRVTAFQSLSKKQNDLRAEIAALAAARTAMHEAGSLDAYREALGSYAEVRFAETVLARPVLKDFPAADDPATRLLMDGDPDAWAAVKKDKAFGVAMHPQDVRHEEVSVLLALRDDPDLKDVWQCRLVSEGGVHTAYSRGPLRESVVGDDTRISGKIWDPREQDVAPAFSESKLTKSGGTQNVSSVALSPTSRLLEGLKLQDLIHADGTGWTRPAFEVIQDVVRAPQGSATARAIFMQQLAALTSMRPYDWGRHYCPSFNRDLAELYDICGGRRLNSYEWMLPATTAKLDDKLSAFFDRLKQHDYLNEARRFRDIALAVREAGAAYAGFVDAEGAAHVLPSARGASELWCVGPDLPVLVRVEAGAPNAGLGTQTRACRPFSPLFQIPLDRAALLRKYRVADPGIPFLRIP